MAGLIIMLFALPALAYDGTFTVTKTYSGGYTNLITNYFHTDSISKASSFEWYDVADDNTETYYVDNSGNNYHGKHYTRVCCGTVEITDEQTVYFGGTVHFSTFYGDYKATASPIRLRIRNGSPSGLKFKSCGSFIAVKGDPNIA